MFPGMIQIVMRMSRIMNQNLFAIRENSLLGFALRLFSMARIIWADLLTSWKLLLLWKMEMV